MNELNNNLVEDGRYYHQLQMQDITEQQMLFGNDSGQNISLSPIPINVNSEIQSNCQAQGQVSQNFSNNVDFPFVRIHAFDIPIANKVNPEFNNNNPLPISSTNNREIKPKIEPIKSELNEVNSITGGNSNESSQQERNSNALTPDSQNNSNAKVPKIIKCKQCMFLTISSINLENHFSITHENSIQKNNLNISRPKLACPGCDNNFYSEIAFCSHLKHDHFMVESEITKFAEYRVNQYNNSYTKKNRIYLKNVECLREHRGQQLSSPFTTTTSESLNSNHNCSEDDFENDLNFIDLINEDNFSYNENDEVMIEKLHSFTSPKMAKPIQKQKITIKSVENLREPLFLQQVQNSINNDKFTVPSFDQTVTNFYDMNTDYLNGFHTTDNNIRNTNLQGEMEQKKTHRASSKIFIKNVDILKQPIFLPPTNMSNVLNVNETLHFNNFPSKEISIPIPPSPHISNSPVTINSNHNDIVETFHNKSFVTEEFNIDYNINNNLIKKNDKFKIYIKNVDILKQPQFQTSPTKKCTNFLHLRTVDELNLMNKNEINLMNNLQHQNIQDSENCHPEILYTSLENSKNLMYNNSEISPASEYVLTNDESILIQNNCNYGIVNLENIIDSTSTTCEEKNYQFHPQYDLHTPQLIMDDRTVSENEREMLLDCAEELILNQQKDETNLNSSESAMNISKEKFNLIEDNIGNKKEIEKEIGESVDELKNQNNNQNIVEIIDEENILNSNINWRDPGGISASDKGRIYVSENLMDEKLIGDLVHSSTIENVALNNVEKKTKGRPLGAKTSRALKFNKLGVNNSDNINFKCEFINCAVRFKTLSTLDYHKKCHKKDSLLSTAMQCPECFSEEFSNWNTLHTHLWRHHSIDMELYNCDLCNFKTPILSRLHNTHMKIHSNERNFKCDQCEKAFKNSKQLKNHRRLHRSWQKPVEFHKCELCSAVFSNTKTKKEHFCQQQSSDQNIIPSKCTICDKLCSSKSSLKLHISTHQESCKFKCTSCGYMTNDHNAFRRHRSTHDKSMMYDCPYCGYKCIQSILYKKHLTTKHPDLASNIIHKCNVCQFTTINQTQFNVHVAKHENERLSPLTLSDNSGNYLLEEDLVSITLDEFGNKILPVPIEGHKKNKIKVKSDLVLTDPTKFSLQTSNDCVT